MALTLTLYCGEKLLSANPDFESYDKSEDLLQAVTASGIRAKVLLSLKEDWKTPGNLKKEIGTRASSISPNLRQLSELGLIEQSHGKYRLTEYGKIVASRLAGTMRLFHALTDYADFLQSHTLKGIPPYLRSRLGDLRGGEIIRAEQDGVLKVVRAYAKVAVEAEELNIIAPVVHEEWVSSTIPLIDKGVPTRIITTPDIAERVMRDTPIRDLLNTLESFETRVLPEPGIVLAVTDNALNLGLMSPDGTYGYSHNLVVHGEDAVRWGKDLFEHYWENANPI